MHLMKVGNTYYNLDLYRQYEVVEHKDGSVSVAISGVRGTYQVQFEGQDAVNVRAYLERHSNDVAKPGAIGPQTFGTTTR
jgi:hypothetical protein